VEKSNDFKGGGKGTQTKKKQTWEKKEKKALERKGFRGRILWQNEGQRDVEVPFPPNALLSRAQMGRIEE